MSTVAFLAAVSSLAIVSAQNKLYLNQVRNTEAEQFNKSAIVATHQLIKSKILIAIDQEPHWKLSAGESNNLFWAFFPSATGNDTSTSTANNGELKFMFCRDEKVPYSSLTPCTVIESRVSLQPRSSNGSQRVIATTVFPDGTRNTLDALISIPSAMVQEVSVPLWALHRVGINYKNEKSSPESQMTAKIEFYLEDYLKMPFEDVDSINEITIIAGWGRIAPPTTSVNEKLNDFFGEGPKVNKLYQGSNWPLAMTCGDSNEGDPYYYSHAIPNPKANHQHEYVPTGFEAPYLQGNKWRVARLEYDIITQNDGQKRHRVRLQNLSDGWGDCRVLKADGCLSCVSNVKIRVVN